MTDIRVKLAGVPVLIRAMDSKIGAFLRDYRSEEEPQLTISMEQADIDRERRLGEENRRLEGLRPLECSDYYLETLAIYRKLAASLIQRDILLFHGSAIAVDGKAYLFTAKSGTGKSTHARLWRQRFGERAVMINDDKPLLRIRSEGVEVFGTPWNGKHRLGGNLSAPLKALCLLQRDKVNHIETVSPEDAFPVLLQQSFHVETGEGMLRVMELLDTLSKDVMLYRLGCNMEPEAAEIAYRGMQEDC